MNFRALTKDDIDVRVKQIKQNGVSLLLYKNARVDMAILDETVGAENWQREHYSCLNSLFCRVSIKCDDAWISKSDCGSESNEEAEKGQSSDSFKRACFCWGIGRELYTAPFIWVTKDHCNIDNSGRTDSYSRPIFKCTDKFIVNQIKVEIGKITALEIYNDTKKEVCYQFGECFVPPSKSYRNKQPSLREYRRITDEQFEELNKLYTQTQINRMILNKNLAVIEDMSFEDAQEAIDFKKKKKKEE